LVAWARGRMARYKAPRRVVVVEDLPRTGTRKVRREQLLPLFDAQPGSLAAEPPSAAARRPVRRNGSAR
ncbi:MAG: hypothetical protein JST64_13585, partial [Actinobacteria bacterium]|nr:hypothetical protein [Actinomycetota bacterium]